MKINKTRIFLACLLGICLCSCGKNRETSKVMINEVLINNEDNYQDDYGMHSAWIEIFNKSYSSIDLAGCLLKTSNRPGDTVTYFIPKGDILTVIKPRQHILFWADGMPKRGTFHVSFTLDSIGPNWIGLYDSGKKLLDEVTVPAGVLKANQSYARIVDGQAEPDHNGHGPWEVKGSIPSNYVTPNTNNQTIDKNEKVEKFEEHDSVGIGMAISAMAVVFSGLILLFIFFKIIGKIAIKYYKHNAMKAQGITDKKEAKEAGLGERPGEIYAAIGLALHEQLDNVHDVENTVLTIHRMPNYYSPWSSKIHTLRETPHKK